MKKISQRGKFWNKLFLQLFEHLLGNMMLWKLGHWLLELEKIDDFVLVRCWEPETFQSLIIARCQTLLLRKNIIPNL